jgi:hypothetical protein
MLGRFMALGYEVCCVVVEEDEMKDSRLAGWRDGGMGSLKVESCRFTGSTQDKTAPLTQVTGMKIFMQAEGTSKEDVVGVFIGGVGDRGKEGIRATGEDV